MTKTADGSFDLTEPFEMGKRVDSAGEIVCESYVAFDGARIAFPAHKLHRHPEFQRVEAPSSHLTVAEEVELNVGAAAIFAQVFRSHIKRVAQHASAFAHECCATGKRNKHPLVRVKRDRISLFDAV